MKYSVSIKQLDGSYKIYLKEASPKIAIAIQTKLRREGHVVRTRK